MLFRSLYQRMLAELRLGGEIGQHALVEVAPEPRQAALDLGAGADRGEVEEGDLHRLPLLAAGRVDRQRFTARPGDWAGRFRPRCHSNRNLSGFPVRRAQYGVRAQCAAPVTGFSSMPTQGAKNRDTKS